MTQDDLLTDLQQNDIPADKGARFLNYLIDILAFYALSFLVGMVIGVLSPEWIAKSDTDVGTSLMLNLIFLVFYVLYFGLFEGATNGKTLGKMVTKTRAVREDGQRFTYTDGFTRALIRIIPFEPFSALGDRPWHDKWSKTIVVKNN